MSAFHDNMLLGASGAGGGYKIERSLRFNSADSAYLNRTPASAGNRKTWTWSGWVKRSSLTTGQWLFGAGPVSTDYTIIRFGSGGSANDFLEYVRVVGTVIDAQKISSAVYRDTSAWYHIVVAEDAANTVARVYVNGSEISYSTNDNPSNVDGAVNNTGSHEIGRYVGLTNAHFSGYLTEINFIDGQALTPSSFGEINPVTGVWQPKKYTGTYGTNGFYLNFSDNSGTTSTTLGKDSSGNGNNWTPNNFSVTAGSGNDSLIDTPTPYADGGNGRGNYCTWLPQTGGQTWTFSNGNLDAVNGNTGVAGYSCIGTIAVSTGKWYWEVRCNDAGGTTLRVPGVGIMGSERDVLTASATIRPDVYLSGNGTIDNSAGTALQSGFGNMAAGDIVGVAVDADAKTVQFYRNGSAVGTAQSYTPAFVTPSFYSYSTYDCNANFGQRPFAYTPPSGFKALNTQNLPEPTIKKPSSYMDVVTYTGTGSAMTPTSSLGFSPDLVWIKSRSAATDHALYDAVRGTEKRLESNNTDAEVTSDGGVTAFNSAGFTLGTLAQVNTNTATYTAWCWDESATPGFDIVTYTGNGTNRTIAHSLGVAPSMMIVKNRSAATDWAVWSKPVTDSLGASYCLFLQSTVNAGSYPGVFNSTAPTSSVFSVGTSSATNTNGDNYVAYLWSEVAGFSKFGSYTGNGSTDGPFVYLGFKPRWLMIKRSDSTESWLIFDTARETYNPTDDVLWANLSNAESANYTPQDFTSNGFKIRTSSASTNASGGTYIYAAFAETPFRYSLAR